MFPIFVTKSEKFPGRIGKFPAILAEPPKFNNSFFKSDEFRMFAFKIKLCPLTHRHDWTDCPYAHPGEKARRRDPSQIKYLAIACPEHKSNPGNCPRGELCGLAHGIFEYWLHPDKYRTRPCNAGLQCTRKVCFFAHEPSEIRQGVDYGVYWGQGTTGLLPLVKEAPESETNGVGSDLMNLDQAHFDWIRQLIE